MRVSVQAAGAYAGAVVLCLILLGWVMRLWNADLTVLFDRLDEDSLLFAMLTKGLINNGWYLHNRFVGAPAGLDLQDYPVGDNLHFALLKFISLWTSDYAVVLNLYFIVTFPLIVVTSLYVFRRFGISYPSAIAGSLLFAFLPYHFFRGESHIFLAAYYLIPLMTMVILWVYSGDPIFRDEQHDGTKRIGAKAVGSVAICVLVASGGVYYAFFSAFFLLVAGALGFYQHKQLRSILTSGILFVVLSLAFLINESPSILYSYRHGRNTQVLRLIRPGDAEIYGMRIAAMLLPIDGHRVSYLARLKGKYNAQTPLANEATQASLGAIGGLGFLILIGYLMCGKLNLRNAELLRKLSVLNISAVLVATMGGFGALVALMIPWVRSYNRISVYIAFFSLFAFFLLLDNLVLTWARSKASRWLYWGLPALILLIGILDQTAPRLVPPYSQLKAEYASDAVFVTQIEASVPQNTMIFQLPYLPFPESNPVRPMQDNDLFRGYLHSQTLRWSYGAMRGRDGDSWLKQVVEKPPSEMVKTLALAGFGGIYLDRYGYPDRGMKIEAELSNLLHTNPIVSPNQRLTFFNLAKFRQPTE